MGSKSLTKVTLTAFNTGYLTVLLFLYEYIIIITYLELFVG